MQQPKITAINQRFSMISHRLPAEHGLKIKKPNRDGKKKKKFSHLYIMSTLEALKNNPQSRAQPKTRHFQSPATEILLLQLPNPKATKNPMSLVPKEAIINS